MLWAGMTPLACAVARGKAIAVRYLLDKGANLNKQDSVGFSPLHYATKKGGSLSAPIYICIFITILSLHKCFCHLLLVFCVYQ